MLHYPELHSLRRLLGVEGLRISRMLREHAFVLPRYNEVADPSESRFEIHLGLRPQVYLYWDLFLQEQNHL
jgi:hypothetical protein